MAQLHSPREHVGVAIGRIWAPLIATIARARHARMFHPDGDVAVGRVVGQNEGRYAGLGERLEGPVLARLSGALRRRGHDHLDVLGIALRFRPSGTDPTDVRPQPGDQDLLLATILSPFTMPLSPLTTRTRDFLANRFYAVSPFAVDGLGRTKFRLSPLASPRRSDATRAEHLAEAIEAGEARWLLEARPTYRWPWESVATLALERLVVVDQAALRFDPFRSGRGIVPRGLVHAIRVAAYPASQSQR
jgi:hypothetical protein